MMKPLNFLKKYLLNKIKTRYYRIYILPTKMGFYFLSIILILFVISLSYGNALAYSSTFIFVSVVMTSAIHTHFNLKNVQVIAAGGNEMVQETDPLQLKVTLGHKNRATKYDLSVLSEKAEVRSVTKLDLDERKDVLVTFKNLPRGKYRYKRITLSTMFPFGLFYSWTYANQADEFYIYPKLEGDRKLPATREIEGDMGHSNAQGFSEFEEHVKHTQGMPYNHIDWKLYAKDKGLFIKKFSREMAQAYFFNLDVINDEELEKELSQITKWIFQINENHEYWSIHMNGEDMPPATGQDHLDSCLKKMASYKKEEQVIAI